MSEIGNNEKLMRRFLLGELDAGEQQRLEELFMVDNEYEEKLLSEEEELIEDYLEGALSENERTQFHTHFLASPQQRRRLRVAKSIKKYLAANPPSVAAINPPPGQLRRKYYNLSLRNPYVFLPLAASLIIFISFSATWLVRRQRLDKLRELEQSRRLEVERELAQLNDPLNAGQQAPVGDKLFSVVLLPGSARSMIPQAQLSPPINTTVIELSLVPTTDEYQSYQAILQKVGTTERFTISGLRIRNTPNGKVIPVKIPASLITRGDYQLVLSGLAADGKPEATGNYGFQVSDAPNR